MLSWLQEYGEFVYTLQQQFPSIPHHKHVPPDIKHHRVPAPGLSFTQPNLPSLIQEIEAILASGP